MVGGRSPNTIRFCCLIGMGPGDAKHFWLMPCHADPQGSGKPLLGWPSAPMNQALGCGEELRWRVEQRLSASTFIRQEWCSESFSISSYALRSNGERSLDDVERALWELCKNDRPGFDEEEIRRQLISFGGPEMGTLYDQWVRAPGELPVELQLAKVGLEI